MTCLHAASRGSWRIQVVRCAKFEAARRYLLTSQPPLSLVSVILDDGSGVGAGLYRVSYIFARLSSFYS
jgi:hypothetical protein